MPAKHIEMSRRKYLCKSMANACESAARDAVQKQKENIFMTHKV